MATPGRGPQADRPRGSGGTIPHTPARPMWFCRVDGQPWPCGEARLLLVVEFRDNVSGLTIYLAGLMYEAMRDLYRLNPHDGPDPKELFARFVAWGAARPPAAEGAE
ncbi:hypothetical protein [Micromonospora sp. NPDC051296]|uniref:hypothetical protein n=1 Tax=Micromonospora sp. NPDC051296 TaxID=3155046 RepID=UPI00341DD052